jgi:hypothetical protein
MSDAPRVSRIMSQSRKARKARVRGVGAKCKDCGTDDPLVLLKTRPILCEACKRRRDEKSARDGHHPSAKANSTFTIPVPVNSHRRLTDAQNNWDPETWRNPTGCPLRAAAGCIQGFIDTCKEMMDAMLAWIVEMLEALSDLLREQLGERWWVGTPLEQWARPPE